MLKRFCGLTAKSDLKRRSGTDIDFCFWKIKSHKRCTACRMFWNSWNSVFTGSRISIPSFWIFIFFFCNSDRSFYFYKTCGFCFYIKPASERQWIYSILSEQTHYRFCKAWSRHFSFFKQSVCLLPIVRFFFFVATGKSNPFNKFITSFLIIFKFCALLSFLTLQ